MDSKAAMDYSGLLLTIRDLITCMHGGLRKIKN